MIGLGMMVSAIGSLYTGITTLRASNERASDIESQGRFLLSEALRDAAIIREEGRTFAANQSLQFIGAGVELVGSALITMAQTVKFADTEAAAKEAQGRAGAQLAGKQAEVQRAEGRGAFVGSIIKGGAALIPVGA